MAAAAWHSDSGCPRSATLIPVFGTASEVAGHVLLGPFIAQHSVDVTLAGRVGLAVQHRKKGATHDLLRPLRGHRATTVAILGAAMLSVLSTAANVLADLLFGPVIVDDPAAVGTHANGIGVAS